jgi:1-acyl-sn-glycerol-3-phosphate acyltransferase
VIVRLARTVGFMAAFYVMTATMLVVCLPLLLAPRRFAMMALAFHARCSLRLLEAIAGIRVEVRGRDHIPLTAALVASKHQSAWETFALFPLLPDAAMIMKAELGWIPLYGWFSIKCEHILVARTRGSSALRQMIANAKVCAAKDRQIVIFPEGTRQAVGAPPLYRSGVAALYADLSVPCVPVALNSGVFWPRRQLLRAPGKIIVEFLEPIAPGLDRATFIKTLENQIETATDRLVTEAYSSKVTVPA